MNSGVPSDDRAGDDAVAQASEWLALLHSDERSPEMEVDFRRWLDADPVHPEAFAAVTQTWDLLGSAGGNLRRERRRRVALTAGAALGLVAVGAGVGLVRQPPTRVFETGRGEQRTFVLKDGSKIALNTDSRLTVRYESKRRSLRLEQGEAAFEVTHDRSRPFVVEAVGENITAVGTSFVVRAVPREGLRVTLGKGRLRLAQVGGDAAPSTTGMEAGQRWTATEGVVRLNAAQLAQAYAWRRGEVVFDDTPVAVAIAEMNRYGARPIVLSGVADADNRISGIFRPNDGRAFAETLARLYGLRLEEDRRSFHLVPEAENNLAPQVLIGQP